jgi:hypothetical protein
VHRLQTQRPSSASLRELKHGLGMADFKQLERTHDGSVLLLHRRTQPSLSKKSEDKYKSFLPHTGSALNTSF